MTNIHRSRRPPRTAMPSRRTGNLQRVALGLALGWFGVATACSLQNLDYLSSDLENPNCDAGGSDGVTSPPAGTTAAPASGGAGTAAPLGALDFDSAGEVTAWSLSDTGSTPIAVSWAEAGQASPLGAMQLTTGAGTRLSYPVSRLDLAGFSLKALIRSGDASASVKPYVTCNGGVDANGAAQSVGPSWTVVSMDVGHPSEVSTGYDPTQIIGLGYVLSANATFLIDRIWLE
jgi:hypothetical protein